jgi:hypothetical protein
MAVCCGSCSTVVRVDSETVVLTHSEWCSHRVGMCPICGRQAQWHRPIVVVLALAIYTCTANDPSRVPTAVLIRRT